MPRTVVFDGHFHAPLKWGDIAFVALLKSRWDEYRKSQDQKRENEHLFESEYRDLEAMVHWRDPRPSPCLSRCGRRHLLDDNPCSG
jgi:hypothetical protein